MTEHPIAPPSQLLQLWFEQHDDYNKGINELLIEATRYGADQELEACRMEIIDGVGRVYLDETKHRVLLAESIWIARRPKPQTLNSIALQMLGTIECDAHYLPEITDTIRRALEQLPE
jgi:hypothetical protein